MEEDVRWRVLNLQSQPHPMHLHGFFFTVDSLGNGLRDMAFKGDAARHVVTQLLTPGATMAMTWRPEREGNGYSTATFPITSRRSGGCHRH